MIWIGWLTWVLVWGTVGSFGTAYIHEQQGRDVTTGGLIGMVVGAVGGIFFLMLFLLWLYYTRPYSTVGRLYNPRKRWYTWYN